MPLAAKYTAIGLPKPPQPTTKTEAFCSFCCPTSPISDKVI